MTDTIIELTEEAFDAQYPLRTNHLDPDAGWAFGDGAGCLFETYGEELAFVRRQDPRHRLDAHRRRRRRRPLCLKRLPSGEPPRITHAA